MALSPRVKAICLTVFKVVVYSICLSLLLYQVIRFLVFAASDPVGSSMETVPFDSKAFEKVLVCIQGWEKLIGLWRKDKIFPLGFGSNLRSPFLKMTEERYDQALNLSRSYMEDESKYLDRVNELYNVTDDAGNVVELQPTFLFNKKPCGYLTHKTGHKAQLNYYVATTDFRQYQFRLPREGNFKFSLSMYVPEYIDHLLEKHYMKYEPPDDTTSGFIHLSVAASKSDYLKNHHNCTEEDPELILPVGYREEACNMECVYETVEILFNCTPHPAYFRGRRQLQPCHAKGVETNVQGSERRQLFMTTKNKCIERRGCADQKSCTEWKIQLTNSKPTNYVSKSKAVISKFFLRIVFEPKKTIFRQFRLLSFESIIGNIGGLSGLWLGLSIFGFCNVLFGASKLKKEKEEEEHSKSPDA